MSKWLKYHNLFCRMFSCSTKERIQKFIWGGNQILQSKVEGEAQVEGAKRLRIEGEARTEGEAREKTGSGKGVL